MVVFSVLCSLFSVLCSLFLVLRFSLFTAQATAKAIAAEVSEEAKSKSLEKTRDAKIAKEEQGTMTLLQEIEKDSESNNAKDMEIATESEVIAQQMSLRAREELRMLMKSKAEENMVLTEMHAADMKKWNTVSSQLNSDYSDYLRLADRTQQRIDSGWWPEFTLLSKQQVSDLV